MALKREMLKGMGLTEEQITAIIDAHTDTVNGLKDELKKHGADADRIKTLEDKLKAYEGGEDWKKQAEDIRREFDQFKQSVEAEKQAAKVKGAYRKLLEEAKIDPDYFDVILRATGTSDMKLGDDGKLKDADKLTEAIKADWGKFIMTEGKKGAEVPPGQGGGGKSPKTVEEIMAIEDATARTKAIAENHELFGF